MRNLVSESSREKELADIASADPKAWSGITSLLENMSEYVSDADQRGDLPDEILNLVPANLLNRMNLPVQYGGLEATSTAYRRAIVFEMVGRICAAIPMALPGPGLAMPPINSLGTEAQKEEAFGKFSNSETPRFGAFAITEPQSGSDAVNMRTTAIREGDHYVLNGEKCFITNGARADVIVVFASIAPDKGRFGVRAFIVEKGTPGFNVDRTEDMMGLRASQLTSLSFTNCVLHQSMLLGHTGKRGPFIDAFTGAQNAWDYMRPALASGINGACLGVLDYAETQIQSSFGSYSQNAAKETLVQIERYRQKVSSARLIAMQAASKFDCGEKISLGASMAKSYSSKLAMDIAHTLAQLFPDLVVERGNKIEKFYRDAKAFDILEGTGDMQRLMIANAYQPESMIQH